jgi:tetratricopeptide (TPR) repeat protein
VILLAFGCAPPAPPEPTVSSPCREAFVPAPGPLAEEAAALTDPVALGQLRLREARLSGDPGFYELADLAARCRLDQDPADPAAVALHAEVLVQFHRFAEAEELLAPLAEASGDWRHLLLLGDARVDQGDLDGAAEAWSRASSLRPGPLLADRFADLAWQRGDLAAAITWEEQALAASTTADPEPYAWVASRLGWYRALAGQVPNELGLALRALPDHKPSNLLYGRFMLADGRPDLARPALERVGPTVEALRLLRELDPATDVSRAALQDRRGWAITLAETDPAAALPLLDAELLQRRDATTRVARAWVAARLGQDVADEVRDALSTGILEPEVLLMAAEALRDPDAVAPLERFERALTPGQRIRLTSIKNRGGK